MLGGEQRWISYHDRVNGLVHADSGGVSGRDIHHRYAAIITALASTCGCMRATDWSSCAAPTASAPQKKHKTLRLVISI